tara:strand:+ start:2200 stop:3663 length:1464 start_codon:yes stop_codon:yes gene_type:complete
VKEVILHIGAHKTGSTALQNFLHENGKILSKNKIYYPDFNMGMNYHHVLLRPICKPQKNDFIWDIGHEFSLETKDDFSDYFSTILSKDFNRLVVSTEFLFLNKPFFRNIIEDANFVEYIREVFSDYKIRPVVYLRNPMDWVESCYVEAVKGAHTCWHESFERYFEMINDWLDYFEYLRPWHDAFGDDVQIYCYENVISSHKDIIAHFCDRVLGLPLGDFNSAKKTISNNPSPSREFIQLLLSFNRLNNEYNDGQKFSFPYSLEDILNNGWYGKGHYLSHEASQSLFKNLSSSFVKLDELSENQFFYRHWLAAIELRLGEVKEINIEESLLIFIRKLCELNSKLSFLEEEVIVRDEKMKQALQDNSLLKVDLAEKNQEIDALVLRSERQISDINNLVGRSDEQLREISRLVQKCDGYLSEIKALVYNCDSLKDERNKLTNDVLEYNRVNQELSFKMNELSSLNILIQEKLEYATKHPFSFCLNTLLNK